MGLEREEDEARGEPPPPGRCFPHALQSSERSTLRFRSQGPFLHFSISASTIVRTRAVRGSIVALDEMDLGSHRFRYLVSSLLFFFLFSSILAPSSLLINTFSLSFFSPFFLGMDVKQWMQILKIAREKFTQEISFKSEDKDVSLARALLYIAAEDEAFMAFHRDMDMCSFVNERKDAAVPFKAEPEVSNVEDISLAGKSVSGWLNELDTIAKEVETELVSRDIGCHLEEVLEAVNAVLFESRGFKRLPVFLDSKFSYFHIVLSCGCGSAIVLSIIYIEICRRLGITIVGSCVGEDFLIWPQTGNPERLHWKRAPRANWGLMLTSPLRPVHPGNDKTNMAESTRNPLFRPQELRLAIMASERLLILQPHNWRLRRDHGMLLYFNRRYGEAVQELSICMAFAPVEEAEVLEPFVEKLHLLRLLSSWESWEQAGSVAIP
ncbi:uncharacterized protein LOC103712990 isoform X3 [Phoenix dactylifera]|uniref:Uncharacterized protein LOC103712990 isoform X3 n=1 Tax=Phoenix dactylifera TaxID=42345 RepID=A0A8B9AAV3_PHODC|nr:uncharacterized protein LOC103712990 isoform X3 [Phoenix dactylifera]